MVCAYVREDNPRASARKHVRISVRVHTFAELYLKIPENK